MRLVVRACLFVASGALPAVAGGCGGGTGAAQVEAGTRSALDATSSAVDGPELDASPATDGTAASDTSDDSSTPDDATAPCSTSTISAQVNGATVQFTGCEASETGVMGDVYEYLTIDCSSPPLGIQLKPGTSTGAFQFVPDPSMASYSGSATVTITMLGPVGGFVEGTASAPQLQSGLGDAGPTMSFQGSFRVCRRPDSPDIGH